MIHGKIKVQKCNLIDLITGSGRNKNSPNHKCGELMPALNQKL
jgi:hypothetical protein